MSSLFLFILPGFIGKQNFLHVPYLVELPGVEMGVVVGHPHRPVARNRLYLAVRHVRQPQQGVEEMPPAMKR